MNAVPADHEHREQPKDGGVGEGRSEADRPGRTRPMASADLAEVAQLHLDYLEAGFFGRLGPRFLRRYYESFIASPYSVASVVGDRPVAMLVGTTHNEMHYRWVLRHRGLRLAASGGLALLLRPRLLVNFIRTRLGRYFRGVRRVAGQPGATESKRTEIHERVAVLAHVAVSAAARRRRLGATLVDEFVAAARADGADRALLVTLQDSAGTESFYLSLGWDPTGSKRDKDERVLTMFELRLKEPR